MRESNIDMRVGTNFVKRLKPKSYTATNYNGSDDTQQTIEHSHRKKNE